ncbi:DUF7385 family protein [Halomarina litorea]|uniref:DUF7385 family protein n=1 Tax=Halomarina litorea TaxID=2961595 RepID=UPI0020C36D3F|nr:hypothetical protein [Halomarina sp. BCD28]
MDDDEFDELVASLTPTSTVGTVRTYRNTVSVACPACDRPFDDLVVCGGEYDSLELDRLLDLCVGAHEGDVLLFTHKN